jgi:hypothetical protein
MNDSSPYFHANPGETPLPSGSGLSRRFWTTPLWRALPGGMRRRWWMFRPLDLIPRHWPVFKKPRGVLVMRMDGIGDMVLFRRTLDRYAEVFGVDKSEITILDCASWANLADVVFEGYKVYAIDEHAFARRPFYRLKISLWVHGLASAVIVGGGHFDSFVPYPKEITPPTARFVYKGMECYHCFWRSHLRANKHKIFPCVGSIGEERILAACETLLGAGPGAP